MGQKLIAKNGIMKETIRDLHLVEKAFHYFLVLVAFLLNALTCDQARFSFPLVNPATPKEKILKLGLIAGSKCSKCTCKMTNFVTDGEFTTANRPFAL